MKKLLITVLAGCLLFIIGCQNERESELVKEADPELTTSMAVGTGEVTTPMGMSYPGRMIIKIDQDKFEKFKFENKSSDVILNSVPTPMAAALRSINATNVRRLFPDAGKFEKRSRDEGMHLWYVIEFDEAVNLSTAFTTMSNVPGVNHVETCPVIELMSAKSDPANLLIAPLNNGLDRKDITPFNDPRLKEQWHYNNTAKVTGGVMGSDINLFSAWEITTGTPNVIVCVVDGGIDVSHVDLKDNLWINTAELNGEPGVDDDGNGYVDDIHGFCFVTFTGEVWPDDDAHGTHVAGTIAAKNNNGIGVCGVAGGDGTPNSGVRLMSAGIFRDGYIRGGDEQAALKYGADNGAVISQNSWGYPYRSGIFTIPGSLKAAIDYFNKYAGVDENGNQAPDSPMKGGLVIFAAGNDDKEFPSQPSAYDGTLSVSAIGPDFKKATYSTYGEWVDIAAPGGDQNRFGTRAGVLSTLAKHIVSAEYGFYHGTSMACPHVSGVAALVVSKFGGPGFTSKELRTRLEACVQPVDINEKNPDYVGKLGRGYVDAYLALTLVNQELPPEQPKFNEEKSKDSSFTSIDVVWYASSDPDDGIASYYKLYFSDEPLNKGNYKSKGKVIGPKSGMISGLSVNAGEEISYRVNNLIDNKEYYFALEAYDRWNLVSEPSFITIKTKKNTPPTVTNLPQEPIQVLDVLGEVEYKLQVEDIDGHSWKYEISGQTLGISVKKMGDNALVVKVRPVLPEGDHEFTLTLIDELGGKSEFQIPFRVISVKEPVLKKKIEDQVLGVKNGDKMINLSDYFEPQQYLTLTYTAKSSDGTVVGAKVANDGQLTLTPHKPGKIVINVEASNGYKKKVTSFEVMVVEDMNKDVYSVWPLPIKSELNVWLNPNHTKAKVQLISVNGELMLDKDITPNSSGIATINMKNVAPGSYTLRIDAGKNPYVKSVLKQ